MPTTPIVDPAPPTVPQASRPNRRQTEPGSTRNRRRSPAPETLGREQEGPPDRGDTRALTGHDDPAVEIPHPPGPPVLPNLHRLVWRTIKKAWDDGVVGWAAQAAFWQALSLPPLVLGILGSVGYIAGWFGPDTVDVIYERIIAFANRTFSDNVVSDIIKPTVDNVLGRGKVVVISAGFIISLWAGSSAVSCFVASIVRAHDQHQVRNPVWQRFFALFLYVGFLIIAVFLLPLVALGPNYLHEIVPESWDPIVTQLIDYGYFPFVAALMLIVLTTLYHLALPNPLPWHRLVGGAVVAGVFFWIASYILRIYLTAITRAGYTYGALATPIAFLLFTFFLGFAIVVGAEFNAAVQSLWPAKPAASTQVRDWVSSQTSDITGQLKTLPDRLSSGPIRRGRSSDDPGTGRDQPVRPRPTRARPPDDGPVA
ncbi:YihY/virulence factor BrkB family protein [Gordonia sp. DT101]|uniref:YihY/virulence factor BrkB family protein n=1 Tax=Gordonia sp. DT101 TaxID=3416545 RepID=UPI003CF7DD39